MTESPASRVISSLGISISPFLRMAPMIASFGNLILEICLSTIEESGSTPISMTSASSISLNTDITLPFRRCFNMALTVISRGLMVISIPMESRIGKYSGSLVITKALFAPCFLASKAERILFSSSSERARKKSASFIFISLNKSISVPLPCITTVLFKASAAICACSLEGSMMRTSRLPSSKAFAR